MITIFTPTYNRAYRLPALYQSLQRQNSKAFEWIIVDDGSTDNTKELVNAWLAAGDPFEIRYYYKENGGKHTAINLGVQNAKYDWFFIVDSDDFLTDDAVAKIHDWIGTVCDATIAAVSGTRCFPDTQTIGQCSIEQETYVDAANYERRKYRLLGDKAEVYRTEILNQYPFPVFPGEHFLAEGAVWDKIALEGYKVRWFNYPTVVCEYLPDGLTAQLNESDIEVRSFEGCTYYTQIALQVYSGIDKLRIICQYINKGRKKGLSYAEISQRININSWVIFFLAIPVYIKNMVKGVRGRICTK